MTLQTLKINFYNQLSMFVENDRQSFFKLLCLSYLNLKAVDIVLNDNLVISQANQKKFEVAIKRLQNYEPIQYILGSVYFFSSEFKVDPSVLIPRPETEELVAWILDHFNKNDSPTILDLGTGSGCIAISLAKHLPNAKVFALDVSSKALNVAKYNAKINNVEVTFLKADMMKISSFDFDFDAIVSNPPYVCFHEKAQMKTNVLNYEPHLALFVNDDTPLQFYMAIKRIASHHLKSSAVAFMEINEAFADEMTQLFNDDSFQNTIIKKDTFGKPRMLKTQKK